MPQKDPCQKHACEIQKCLQELMPNDSLPDTIQTLHAYDFAMFLSSLTKDPVLLWLLDSSIPANNYLESKCEAIFQEMRRCCARYPKGRSISCSGFELEEEGRQKQQLASDGTRAPPS